MVKTQLTSGLYQYVLAKGVREHTELQKLRSASSKLANSNMLTTPDQGALMSLLCKLIGAKKYLEIGVFTGYSTLWVALSMPADAKITALDISDEHLGLAKEHWTRAAVNNKIKVHIAPAETTLEQLVVAEKNSFDMAFIDANKSQYVEYYEYCLNLVRPGGLIIIDNVLMRGEVVEETSAKNYVATLQRLNNLIINDSRVEMCLLPIGDGMTLARKKD